MRVAPAKGSHIMEDPLRTEVPATTGTPMAVEEDSPTEAREVMDTHSETEEVRAADLHPRVLQETPATQMATGAAQTRSIAVETRRYGRGTGKAPTR